MTTYQLKIVMPEKKIYAGEVVSITVPGVDGLLSVLAGHEAMVALLSHGVIIIRTPEEELAGEIGPGFLEVSLNEAVVMIRTFRWMHELYEETETTQETSADEMRSEGSLRKLKESSKSSVKHYSKNENIEE